MLATAPPTESDRKIAAGLKLLLQRSGIKVSRIVDWESDGKKLTGSFVGKAPQSPKQQPFDFTVDDKGFTYQPKQERSDARDCSGKSSLPCGDSCISDQKSCRIKDALSVRMGQQLINAASGSNLALFGGGKDKYNFSMKGKKIEVSNEIRSKGIDAVVDEVERQIRDCEYEVMAAINPKTGEIVFQKQGGETSIYFTPEERVLAKGAIVTHNHPDLGEPPDSDLFKGAPFSPDDISFACINQVAEMRAVGHENVHSIKPPDKGWDKEYLINEVGPTYDKHFKDNYYELVDEMRSNPFASQDQVINNHIHRTIERTAKDIGFKYERKQNRVVDKDFRKTWHDRKNAKEFRKNLKALAILGVLAVGAAFADAAIESAVAESAANNIKATNRKMKRDAAQSPASPEAAKVGRQIKAIVKSVYQKPLRLHAFDATEKGEAIGVFSGVDDGELYRFTVNPNTSNFRYVEVDKSRRTDAYLIGWIVDGGMLRHDRKSSGKKKCTIGKTCGDTCIEKGRECSTQLQPQTAKALRSTVKEMQELKQQGKSFPGGAILAKAFTGVALTGAAAGAAYAISKRREQGLSHKTDLPVIEKPISNTTSKKQGVNLLNNLSPSTKRAVIAGATITGLSIGTYMKFRADYRAGFDKSAQEIEGMSVQVEADLKQQAMARTGKPESELTKEDIYAVDRYASGSDKKRTFGVDESKPNITFTIGGFNDWGEDGTGLAVTLKKTLDQDSVIPLTNKKLQISPEDTWLPMNDLLDETLDPDGKGGTVKRGFLARRGFTDVLKKAIGEEGLAKLRDNSTYKSVEPVARLVLRNVRDMSMLARNAIQNGSHPDAKDTAATMLAFHRVYPDKPLHIVAHSGGGIAAAEAAEILNRKGIKVKVVNVGTNHFGLTDLTKDQLITIGSKGDYMTAFPTQNPVTIDDVTAHNWVGHGGSKGYSSSKQMQKAMREFLYGKQQKKDGFRWRSLEVC